MTQVRVTLSILIDSGGQTAEEVDEAIKSGDLDVYALLDYNLNLDITTEDVPDDEEI